jgi:hypothetical protein
MVTVLIKCGSVSIVNDSLNEIPRCLASSMQNEASHKAVAHPALTVESRHAFCWRF